MGGWVAMTRQAGAGACHVLARRLPVVASQAWHAACCSLPRAPSLCMPRSLTLAWLAAPCPAPLPLSQVLFYNPPGSPFHVNGTSGLAFQPYGVNSTKTSSRLASHERDAQLALLIGDLSYAL